MASYRAPEVWLKRRVEPSSIDDNFKDGYLDMLSERRKPFNDLSWVLKKIDTPQYKYKYERGYEQLNKDVLNSDRVQNVIEKIAKERKKSVADVRKHAEQMLHEMAHKFSMKSVRTLGYALIKVLKAINDHIYVNATGLNMLYDLVHEYPVVLVPSHRSYLDFIILSLLCFNYDLPLPAIVAAQDFMGMAVIGSMLRHSGAFYIRRAFRSDDLYWAIFTEYVQTQLYNGDHPIEFFVEGTRSRTQKAYMPKLGALDACLEAYFKGMVPDVMIVPISISYDKVLEENLFAQELLGIPKPKESTSKLFKAFSILRDNYGTIHVTISNPISARQMSVQKVHRPIHSLEPRFQVSVTPEEVSLVEDIGKEIVWEQQRNMVLSVWCLIATVLLQKPNGIPVIELTETVLWLKRHANNIGAYIDWPSGFEDEEVIRSCLASHQTCVKLDPKSSLVTISALDHGSRLDKASHMAGQILADAATHMVVVIYRNQLVHAFVPYSLIAMIVLSAARRRTTLTIAEARSSFEFAVRLFEKEFVLNQKNVAETFDDAVQMLVHTNDLVVDPVKQLIFPQQSLTRFTLFLSNILLPFSTAYWVMCQFVRHTTFDLGVGKEPVIRPKELVSTAQQLVVSLIEHAYTSDYELLNLDVLNNCVHSLTQLGAVYYERRNDEKFAAVKVTEVENIINSIEKSSPIQLDIPETVLRALAINSSIKAKL